MKKVVDKHTVAHLWANQMQDEARTPTGNLFFRTNKIYSYGYHFQIACHIVNKNGEKAILFTNRKYSVTTSQHISIVSRAIPNYLKVIQVPDLDRLHEAFAMWEREAEGIAEKLKNARKPEIYLNMLDGVKAQVMDYATFYGLELPTSLNTVLSVQNKTEFAQYTESKAAFAKEAELKRFAAIKIKHKEELKKFRNFKISSLSLHDGFDYLRFNTDKLRVETSQSVQIPLQTAKEFYSVIRYMNINGGCVDCNIKLMDYNVKEINKDFIHVGCHKITIKEVMKLAKQLNF